MLKNSTELFAKLEDSGLLSKSIVARREELLKASSAEEAASELVRLQLLTKYQSEVLVQDKTVPLVIGEYIVEDVIGQDGMGYVLRARHRRMKRTVAIKFLLKSLTESEDLVVRFEREVEAAARLDHQNIVTAYDAGVHDGNHFLVMQYIDGDDLSDVMKTRGQLEVANAIDVIRQAAYGLAYAHDRGIIHRDIKPANLLLDDDGVVRILDMGLARIKPTPGDEDTQALTNTGSMMGTVDYMAPEQAMDAKSVDLRADIYSLGCTLYFLLIGRSPYNADSMMKRLLAHREGQIPRLSSNRYGIPDELEAVYQKMIAKDPGRRFQSMTEVITSLESIDLDDEYDPAAIATLDMPEDSSGEFNQITDEDDSEIPQTDQTFVTPDRPASEPRQVTASPKPTVQPNNVVDASMVETTSAAGSADASTADQTPSADTLSATIIDTPGQLSTSEPQSATASHDRRPLIAGIVVATTLVALLIIVFGRDPDPNGASGEKGGEPGSATVGQAGVPPSKDAVSTGQSAPNYALEFRRCPLNS
ncbi:MAG: serine/threonine protein kinase [Planctomycetales bacterium]|jgi:serine/threonine protein kinase